MGIRSAESASGTVENLSFEGGKALARVRPPAREETAQVHLFLQSEGGGRASWVQIESLHRESTDPDGVELWTAMFDPLPDRSYMARARFKTHVSNCQIAEV